jgi:hypothetical protein
MLAVEEYHLTAQAKGVTLACSMACFKRAVLRSSQVVSFDFVDGGA